MRARFATYLTSKSFRGVGNWLLLNVFRIDHDVFDALPLPSVSHMDEVVTGLDDGGIRKLAGDVLQSKSCVPVLAIFRSGDGQRRAIARGGIVNEQVAAILQR